MDDTELRKARNVASAAFVLAALPTPPARVLEVGCGAGDLARGMAAAGHRVLAIDPDAPSGPIFRRTKLEDLRDTGTFEAVVARYSLHHIEGIDSAIDRIADLLEPQGRLAIEEFGWDLFDDTTADWYGLQQGAPSAESLLAEWRAEHDGLHGYEDMRRGLDRHFAEHVFEWQPYLYRCLDRDELERHERDAIERGEIRPIGFRYVGIRH
jgi:SAM-dependent methyltransferase